jgi:hypothetical protein
MPKPASAPISLVALLVLAACAGGPLALAVEAPAECGFPDGTALGFAGRSTTALLGVNEAPGDPMSVEPADIYITRDAFDQGELHGRLVCAIFVKPPGFVEITVHPADDPFVPPTPAPAGSQPSDGVDRQQAVEAALAQVDEPEKWNVSGVEAGSVARLVFDWEDQDWTGGLDAEHWVWRIFLSRGDEGVEVFVDYVNGTVLGELRYILD